MAEGGKGHQQKEGQPLGATSLLGPVEAKDLQSWRGGRDQMTFLGLTDPGPLSSPAHVQAGQSCDQSLGLPGIVSWLFLTSCVSLGKLINLSELSFLIC